MTTASKITLVRVVLIPLVMLFMYLSEGNAGSVWLWAALAVFIIASISDYVDGFIARKYNQVSDFGKFLDPLADKLLVIAVMLIFCQWDLIPSWALMIVLAREFAVTGLRLVAVSKGIVIAAGWSGKVKTACTMVGLCFMIVFHHIAWLSITVNVVIIVTTVYSGIEYFIKNGNCLVD